MNAIRKEVAAATVARSTPKVSFTVIDGRKGDKTVTADYLNERLNYFYNNGGPIMDI